MRCAPLRAGMYIKARRCARARKIVAWQAWRHGMRGASGISAAHLAASGAQKKASWRHKQIISERRGSKSIGGGNSSIRRRGAATTSAYGGSIMARSSGMALNGENNRRRRGGEKKKAKNAAAAAWRDNQSA